MEAMDIEDSHNPEGGSSEKREKSFDVFVSFRGPDTRSNFVAFLYDSLRQAGIHVFEDEEDLQAGVMTGQTLIEAITHSKIAILILSENYPWSKWCLRELAQIVEHQKATGQIIIPVFFNVEPAVVKKRSHSYGQAIAEYRQRGIDANTLQEWEEALIHVASISGFVIDGSGTHASIIKELVAKVLTVLNRDFVGIDNHVEQVMKLLNVESSDVRVVGIHGIGGTGKTTIAKLIYNRILHRFDGHSFLESIRERAKKGESLVYLQRHLISDLLGEMRHIPSVDDGTKFIKKVLIVLDDIESSFELTSILGSLDWLGSGSRIVITTRAKQTLDELKVHLRHEVGEMRQDEALKLFDVHAFGKKPAPDDDFTALSKKIVPALGGLPLAIKVVGSYLRSKSKNVWEKTLHELLGPRDEQKLMVFIEALSDKQREIFLDIACFFIGEDERVARYLWSDCHFASQVELKVLIESSIVKIKNNKLWMHDQFRDLGRKIVQREHCEPGKRSRLWIHKEALDVLKNKEGTENVEGVLLKFYSGPECSFKPAHFARTSNIRFLRLDQANLKGNFEGRLSSLRWLHWKGCPWNLRAENLDLKMLVILDLSWSKVNENWNGWREIEKAKNLKVLNLTGCVDLIRTPDLSHFTNLERLILESCIRLVEIDSSVKSLQLLVSLNLRSCTELEKLPEELGSLKSLEEILIERTAIQEIPASIGYLPNLVKLSGPTYTQNSSFTGVKRKYEGNEERIDKKIHVSREVIGKGSNGTLVFAGKYDDRAAAVKRLLRYYSDVADNEIEILKKSDLYDNIVRSYGVEKGKDQYFVYHALELCTCSLDDLIQASSGSSNNPGFPDDPASMDGSKKKLASVRDMIKRENLRWENGKPSPPLRQLMRDVVSGLSQLHGSEILHRDLKPRNVLITEIPFRAKLSGMCISKCLPEDRSPSEFHATRWRAPERVEFGGQDTEEMDLFSLGCVLFFCVTCGRYPIGENTQRDANIASNKMDLSLVKEMPEDHDLFSHLLSVNPKLRPKASEVLRHPFFWTSKMRLSFLHGVSDKVESEAKACNHDLLKELENTAQLVFDGNWDAKIDPQVMNSLLNYRDGNGSQVRYLLRAVRNKFSHHEEDSEEVKLILGPSPDGMDAYFTKRFPRLLIETYRVVRKCGKEELIEKVLSQ